MINIKKLSYKWKRSDIIKINKDIIKQARQTELAPVLIDKFNYDLKIEGNRQYRDRQHSSLVFKNNMYFWNSKQDSGNSVDFLIKHLNLNFKESIEILTNSYIPDKKSSEEVRTQQSFRLPTKADNFKRAFAYLNQTRCIDNSIITQLIDYKLLIQTKKNNNIAFIIKNEHKKIVGAELQGTLDLIKYKGIAPGSNNQYGFNIQTSENIRKLFAFESAIDLLSFYELYRHTEGIKNALLLSLGGLKVNVLRNTLKAFKIDSEGSGDIYICTDNDNASNVFKNDLKSKKINFKEVIVPLSIKDWNDYLKLKKQKKIN